MRMLKTIVLLMLVSIVNAQGAFCPNVDGAIEHPLLTSYKKSCIVGYNEVKFDAVSFPLEKIAIKGTEKKLTVEGKVIDLIYGLDNADNASVLEVQRNYEQALKKGGFEILFSAFGRKTLLAEGAFMILTRLSEE